MDDKKVRVRYAPSPTGFLHIGNAQSALFNYLFARHFNGTMVLRIEDTDTKRNVKDGEESQRENLHWLGIDWDEGPNKPNPKYAPYRQSERNKKGIYHKYIQELLDKGLAYKDYSTEEELAEMRERQRANNEAPHYDGRWYGKSEEEQKAAEAKGLKPTIRFHLPKDHEYEWNDIARGHVSFNSDNLGGDFIIEKSDGMPTYHLANIVDDHLMEITHVIRGEEWLPSMALHLMLYRAFGWQAPAFAHLPLILKPVGNGKLSKRDGIKLGFPVFPMDWTVNGETLKGFSGEGYFPEALINFLALLGWNPGNDEEIFSMEQLVQLFDLEKVHKAGARFDPEKIKWFNHQYLQMKPNAELASLFQKDLTERGVTAPIATVEKVVGLIKERASFVSDFWELSKFFFEAPTQYDEKAIKKQWKEQTPTIVKEVAEVLQNTANFTSIALEEAVKQYMETKGLGFGQVMPPLRLALVGELKGPHIFDIIEVIGKEETLRRLDAILSAEK